MANTEKKKETEKLIKSQEDEGQNLYLRRKKLFLLIIKYKHVTYRYTFSIKTDNVDELKSLPNLVKGMRYYCLWAVFNFLKVKCPLNTN